MWTCCLCCLCLRDSRGPGKAGWVAVLGSSSPQLGGRDKRVFGGRGPGVPCREPQAQPRTQVQVHGDFQPTVYTSTLRHTLALSLPSSQVTVTHIPS